MMQKVCFVIMGFGMKKDPESNRTIDLDATYKKIIRPTVESAGCKCIRADEIVESGIIDRSMYALLYHADIVIADISTSNPNAIYELGVRHSLKPYSTIIIKEDGGKIPFDLGHDRVLDYKHLGNEISDQEAQRSIPRLLKLIKKVMDNPQTDSPLYTYIKSIEPPVITDAEIQGIIDELKQNENTIFALTEKAKKSMRSSDFVEAEKIWKKLSSKVQNENYYIQQQALCKYKSEFPSKQRALTDALCIMEGIENPTDTESLGILGAIHKRLWEETEERSYLDSAIDSYKKGWNLHKDYYTGENYANCLIMKSQIVDGDEKIHAEYEARLTFKDIIPLVLASLEDEEPEEIMWKYATLSNSYYALGQVDEAAKYEKLFRDQMPEPWQVQTFEKTKKLYMEAK